MCIRDRFNTVSGGSQHTVGRYIRTIAGLRVIVSVDRVTVVVLSRVHLVADAVAIRLGIRTGVGLSLIHSWNTPNWHLPSPRTAARRVVRIS